MKRTSIFIIILAIIASAAWAQAPDVDRKKCTTTTTYIHGLQDNFAPGPDPTTPSPALAAYLGPLANPATYDYNAPNNHFGDSFRICGCKTCGGTLEVRVRHTNSTDIGSNDGITVGAAPFNGPRAVSALVWAAGDPPVKTLTFNLDPGKLAEILCAQKPDSQWLDVYVQDDTTIDYIKLTLYHP